MRVSDAPPPQNDFVLGRRIVIRGATGSGKTTVSRRLGALLGLPVIELDALLWQADWQETPRDEFIQKVTSVLARHSGGWVCDGNYRSSAGSLVLEQADTVIWLHLPWRISFWRLLKRTLRRAWTKEPMWAGNTESWRKAFFSKDSILWFSIAHRDAYERNIAAHLTQAPPHVRIYDLRTARDVDALFRAAEGLMVARTATVDSGIELK